MWAGTMSNQSGCCSSTRSANRSTSKRGRTDAVTASRSGVSTPPCTPVNVASGMACSSVPPPSSGAMPWAALWAWVDATPRGRPVVPDV